MEHTTNPNDEKPPVEQWLVNNGKRFAEWTFRYVKNFFKFEPPIETEISRFASAAATFEFSRLFPFAVICVGFGWGGAYICDADIDSYSRWAIWPIAFLSLYGAVRALKHFLRPKSFEWWPNALICIFTATIGVFVLILFQNLTDIMADIDIESFPGRSKFFGVLIKIIGQCYRAVDDPEAGLLKKFMGFIGGVGLCEEAIKILPIYLLLVNRESLPFRLKLSFRTFLTLAFFSGLGFGIGEALYCYAIPDDDSMSSQLARWFACVPSHAIYTMIDAAFLWILQTRIQRATDSILAVCWFMLCVAAVAVLHGIYDVLWAIPFVGPLLDAASLILLWWAVRFAIRRRSSVDGSDPFGIQDFNAMTFKTFGKSFAKTYLIILVGIFLYTIFWCD